MTNVVYPDGTDPELTANTRRHAPGAELTQLEVRDDLLTGDLTVLPSRGDGQDRGGTTTAARPNPVGVGR